MKKKINPIVSILIGLFSLAISCGLIILTGYLFGIGLKFAGYI